MATDWDRALRTFVFFAGCVSIIVLSSSMVLRITHEPRVLTTGQILAQSGMIMLLVSAVYGVAELLWGLPHYRLWILSLATFWSVIGVCYLLADALDERRINPVKYVRDIVTHLGD